MVAEKEDMENMYRRRVVPQVPDSDVLKNGTAVLTGGLDREGTPIIWFPIRGHLQMQLGTVTTDGIMEVVLFFISITKPSNRRRGFAFLADLRASSPSIFRIIIQALERLERQNPGIISVFYIIVPRDKQLLRSLEKQLGSYKKKNYLTWFKSPKPSQSNSLFKTVMVTSATELYQYIDQKNLTEDFAGRLNFNNTQWLRLQKMLYNFFYEVNEIASQLSDNEKRLQILPEELKSKEHDAPESLEEIFAFFQKQLDDVIHEMRLSEVIEECDSLISICNRTGSHVDFLGLVDNPQLISTLQVLNEVKSKLTKINQYLRSIVYDAVMHLYISFKKKIIDGLKLNKMKWIRQVGLNHLESSPLNIANNLDEAERKRNDFIESIWQEGSNSLKDCERELEKVSLIESSSHFTLLNGHQYYSTRKARDVETTLAQLNQELKEMEMQLTKFRELLYQRKSHFDNIHHFFLMVGRLIRWYRRTIKQLPTHLLPPPNSYQSSRDSVTLTSSWQSSVRSYLLRHPCPKQSHIDRLKETLPLLKNINLRNQTRLLVYRLNVLIKLLSNDQLPVGEYRELLTWQSRQQKHLSSEGKELLETASQSHLFSDIDSAADAEARQNSWMNSVGTDSGAGRRRYKKRVGLPNSESFDLPHEQGISLHRSPMVENGSLQHSRSQNRRQRGALAKLPKGLWAREGFSEDYEHKQWPTLNAQSRSISDQNLRFQALPLVHNDSMDNLTNDRTGSLVSDFSIFDDNLSLTSSSQIEFPSMEPPRSAINKNRRVASLSDLNSGEQNPQYFDKSFESERRPKHLRDREMERRRHLIRKAEHIASSEPTIAPRLASDYQQLSTSLDEEPDDDDASEEDLGVVLNELCSTFTKDSALRPPGHYSLQDDTTDDDRFPRYEPNMNSFPARGPHSRSALALWDAADDEEIPSPMQYENWSSSRSLSSSKGDEWRNLRNGRDRTIELEVANDFLSDQMYVHRYDED